MTRGVGIAMNLNQAIVMQWNAGNIDKSIKNTTYQQIFDEKITIESETYKLELLTKEN